MANSILSETDTFQITTDGKWYQLRLNDGVDNPIIMQFNRSAPFVIHSMHNYVDTIKDELDQVLENLEGDEDHPAIPGFEGTLESLDRLTIRKEVKDV